MASDEKIIKDAQYRKGLSIAFFNATNATIALIGSLTRAGDDMGSDTDVQGFIKRWRDWLLEEHKDYYSRVIAGVGATYKAEETIKRLRQCDTKEKLRLVWLSISEDERRDGEIIKVAKEIKASVK